MSKERQPQQEAGERALGGQAPGEGAGNGPAPEAPRVDAVSTAASNASAPTAPSGPAPTAPNVSAPEASRVDAVSGATMQMLESRPEGGDVEKQKRTDAIFAIVVLVVAVIALLYFHPWA